MSKKEFYRYFEKKPHKASLHTYRIGKKLMNYAKVGDGDKPLVLFIHGSPGSLSAFIDFLADSVLVEKAVLISVDRPGFGASDYGYAEPSLEKQAAMIIPIIKNLSRNRPVILVGHSLGGPLIGRMAMDYPDLIDGLVMVAPSVDPDLEPGDWYRGPLATPFLNWLLPRYFRASNDELYHLKLQLEEMVPLWEKITIPVIVIQGEKDKLVPPGNADFIKAKVTHAPVTIVMDEKMDHFVPWSHPHLIRNAIIELLNAKDKHKQTSRP